MPDMYSDCGAALALAGLDAAKALAPALVQAAQAQYDRWDESDIDTYAGGGICHFIADDMASLLANAGFEAASVSSSHEQHVYVVFQASQGVYMLDLPWHCYERGGGFSWTKLPDIVFSERDLVWYRLDPDPETFAIHVE